MAFDLQSGYGAGAGADMLQQILRQKAEEAFRNQQLAMQEREAQQRAAYQTEALKSLQEERAAREQQLKSAQAKEATGLLSPQDVVNPTAGVLQMVKGTPYEDLFQRDKTLDSRDLNTGAANPGQATGQLRYSGTPQQNDERARQAALMRFATSRNPSDALAGLDPEKAQTLVVELAKEANKANQPAQTQNVYERTATGGLRMLGVVPKGSNIANAPTPPQAPIQLITTTDDNGNTVQKFVKKQEGSSFTKPVGATTEGRVKSAETVNQVGSDIIQKLSDPKVAATLGPVLGRYSKLQDFIGNPPPEYAELAGEIESYALANMGVHGMRSAQGAEQIKKLLEGRHTPESLAATIRGLNNFSEKFVQNTKPGAKPAAASKADPLGIR